jgi:hypothetical protein
MTQASTPRREGRKGVQYIEDHCPQAQYAHCVPYREEGHQRDGHCLRSDHQKAQTSPRPLAAAPTASPLTRPTLACARLESTTMVAVFRALGVDGPPFGTCSWSRNDQAVGSTRTHVAWCPCRCDSVSSAWERLGESSSSSLRRSMGCRTRCSPYQLHRGAQWHSRTAAGDEMMPSSYPR